MRDSRAVRQSHFTLAFIAGIGFSIVLAVGASTASAAYAYTGSPVNRPDLTYQYTVKTTFHPVPLFGGPTTDPNNANGLLFSGLNFKAESDHGAPATDNVDCQLALILTANNNKTIQSIDWTEGGGFAVTGPSANTAYLDATKVFDITVLKINGIAPATAMENQSVHLTFPTGHTFTSTSPGTTWTGAATLDLAALFNTTGITQVSIAYTNLLTAKSDASGTAMIAKNYLGLSPTLATATPEPASLCLLFTGGALMLRRRRV